LNGPGGKEQISPCYHSGTVVSIVACPELVEIEKISPNQITTGRPLKNSIELAGRLLAMLQ
jgi:hypothetical protein